MGILDVPGLSAATVATNYTPKWKTATAYTAGQQVISPNGDVVSAIANHTSGASFTPANWNLSTSFPAKSSVAAAPSTGHLGTYNRHLSAYNVNPAATRKLSAALATAKSGVNLLTKVVMCGDSTTRGVGASNMITRSVHANLRARLNTLGYSLAGTGLVWANPGTGGQDTRWTFASGWGPFTTPIQQCSAANAAATFVSDQVGTAVTIMTLDASASATWSYTIDGGAPVTVTPGASQIIRTTEITGLSNAVHTIVITPLTANTVYLVGIEVHQASGLSLSNLGIGGSVTADWNTNTWYSIKNILTAYAPKAAILQLETNDANNGVALATYVTNLTGAATWLQNLCDVVLMTGYPVQNIDLTGFTSAIYDLADSKGLPLLDIQDRWGTWAAANANGVMPSNLHPGDAGYADAERILAAFLTV